ncbi:MAG TPA: SMI1/KNR4 family protein [Thermoanaerobaculia bacterium]
MNIDEIIQNIAETPGCALLPPRGLPDVAPYRLPADVETFYRRCGGCVLYEHSDYPFRIVEPERFVQANPVIAGVSGEDDISYSWYILGRGGSDEHVTIDLDESRSGRCYDSFWDRHAVAGSSRIIALSMTDLLNRLYANRGNLWYWLQPEFASLGDAYDSAPSI